MKNALLLFVLSSSLLVACGKTKPENNNNSNQPKVQLNEQDIFNKEKVIEFVGKTDKAVQQEAKQKFLTGVDQYRNRKQLDSSVTSFKSSIMIYPFAKTYYELGNAYMDKKDFKIAIDAYKMAEALAHEPISVVLYNLACAYSMLEDGPNSLNYLQLAIENGYVNMDHILNDEDLAFTRKDPNFNETVKTAMAGNTSSDEVMFGMYKSHFASLTLPYNFDEANSQKIDFDKTISYDYDDFVPGMVNSEFSRDVGDEYFYVGKVTENEKYIALVYSQAGMWDEKPPVHVYLATYTPVKGELIDIEKIAGLEYYSDSLRTSTLKTDFSVEVKYFIQEWEKNPDDFGYGDQNKRTGLNQVASKNFKIDVNGNIRESNPALGYLNK